jgi:uncharacterized protein YwgA
MKRERRKALTKLLSCLKAVGYKPCLKTWEGRKTIKNVTYLLTLMGVELPWKFGLYVSGVYSKELAEDMLEYDKKFGVTKTKSNLNLK